MHPSRRERMCVARSVMPNQMSTSGTVGRLVEQRAGVPMIPHTSCQGQEAIFPGVIELLIQAAFSGRHAALPLGNILEVCRRKVPHI